MATPFDPQKPDLEENLNVANMHEELLRNNAAATRERPIREDGTEPVSVWVFVVCAFAVLVAGSVLGSNGGILSGFTKYDQLVRNGYTTGEPPITDDKPAPTGEAMAVYMKMGGTIYSSKCGGCHQATGEGAAGAYPPLVGSEWVTGNSGLTAAIILHGLQGPIDVKGQSWNGNMPSQASGLAASDVAAVLTYIRNSWGNNTGDIITAEMGQVALDIAAEHGPTQVTSDILQAKFDKPLPGATLDPKTVIDLITLEPVESAGE